MTDETNMFQTAIYQQKSQQAEHLRQWAYDDYNEKTFEPASNLFRASPSPNRSRPASPVNPYSLPRSPVHTEQSRRSRVNLATQEWVNKHARQVLYTLPCIYDHFSASQYHICGNIIFATRISNYEFQL